MRFVVVVVAVVVVGFALMGAGACPEPPHPPPPTPDPCAAVNADGANHYGDGVCDDNCAKPDPDCCFIGDPDADAVLQPIARLADGSGFVDLHDGDEVPLILPPQGGKVILVGVRGTNVTCDLKINAGVLDDCQSPARVIGREGRPIELVQADGTPAEPTQLNNYANIPMCPSVASSRDVDEQPYHLEIIVTEARRKNEAKGRVHTFDLGITPICAQANVFDECTCTCDADFITGVPQDQQCPTINDNDPAPIFCASEGEGEGAGEGEGEGSAGEGEGEGEGSQ